MCASCFLCAIDVSYQDSNVPCFHVLASCRSVGCVCHSVRFSQMYKLLTHLECTLNWLLAWDTVKWLTASSITLGLGLVLEMVARRLRPS